MIVFETAGRSLEQCLASAPLGPRRQVHDWTEFERSAPAAACSVVQLDLLDDAVVARLRRFRLRHPSHPIVLVTRGCMENARRLPGLAVDEVVWAAELEQTLPAAVRRILASGPLPTLATSIGDARHLPRSLREALVHACLAERPVYSVGDLAASVHCDRTTLCLQWRKAVGGDAPLRLVDFLGIILLLHAGRRRLGGRKPEEIADDLGLHVQTLRRLWVRLTGHALGRTANEDDLPRLGGTLDAFARTHLRCGPVPAEA